MSRHNQNHPGQSKPVQRIGPSGKSIGPKLRMISRSAIPGASTRGRDSVILSLPFWNSLIDQLENAGLSPSEAIEIDLEPVADEKGNIKMDAKSMLPKIRYQFQRLGLSKKYSLLVRNEGKTIFVVDHETAAVA